MRVPASTKLTLLCSVRECDDTAFRHTRSVTKPCSRPCSVGRGSQAARWLGDFSAGIVVLVAADDVATATGREDVHLHAWTIGGERYGMQFDDYPEGELDETAHTVIGTVGRVEQLLYEYDFGDSWDHVVTVNAVTRHGQGLSKTVCLDGGGACPLEDCGGIGGYSELRRVLNDPTDSEHAHMLGWAGGAVDPSAFDLASVNIRLQKVR